jgi:hypothetical protein
VNLCIHSARHVLGLLEKAAVVVMIDEKNAELEIACKMLSVSKIVEFPRFERAGAPAVLAFQLDELGKADVLKSKTIATPGRHGE